MARNRKHRRPAAPAREAAGATAALPNRTADVYLALLSTAAILCFFPLLRYFFAQDDFILMHAVARDGWAAAGDFFARAPGHFRPLTKAAYFAFMYEVFGLNPVPWHTVSMAVHIVNINLFFWLLRRVGVTIPASLVVTTLFGVSVAFFHVIAWAACIQQLLGQAFLLATLVWGIETGRHGGARARWLSLAAYVLALASVEQTFGAPLILVAYFLLAPGKGDSPRPLLRLVRRFAPHLAVMAVYLLFMAVWKTAPESGYYAYVYGSNIAANLVIYLGWTVQFWAALPSRMALGRIPWSPVHILVAAIVVYNLLGRRWRETVFGLFYFVIAIFPALFLKDHTFYLHTYIPAFGLLYLVAKIVEDLFRLRPLRPSRAQIAALTVVLVSVVAGSFEMVRRNERYKMFGMVEMQRSFVLRRAAIAETVYDGIRAGAPFGDHVERVYIVYGREEGRKEAKWNRTNVEAAIGGGSMINLIYDRPELEVRFGIAGDQIPWEEQYVADIYFHDDFGNCMKMEVHEQEAQ